MTYQEKANRLAVKKRKLLEAKWKSGQGESRNGRLYRRDAPILDELGLAIAPIQDPTKVTCSFCGNHVEKSRVTYGISNPRKMVKTLISRDEEDELQVEQRVFHLADNVAACPNCCLHIKPIYNRKTGELISQGTKFTTNE